VVWTIPPDWSANVTETLEWLTSVLASPIGAEQRFAVRSTPRRSFEMTFKPHSSIRTYFDLFLERAGGSDIYLPIWHDSNKLISTVAAGGSSLILKSLAFTEFKHCPAIFIQGSNPFEYEIIEYFSESGDTLTTSTVLQNGWPAGTRIFPAIKAHIEGSSSASRKADRAYQVRVKFSSHQPNPITETIFLSTYNDQPVLTREPNDVEDLTYEYNRLIAELDNQSGLRRRKDLNAWGGVIQQFNFMLRGREDHVWLKSLLYRLEGRKKPLFIPTFFSDLEPTEILDSVNLTVKRCGYTDMGGPFRGRQMLYIQLRDGTKLFRKILSSAVIGDGTLEEITVDTAFVPTIDLADIHRISFMAVSRLDSDSIEIVHETDTYGIATCKTNFRTIANVRTPLPDPPDNQDDNETGFVVGADPHFLYFEVTLESGTGSHSPQIGIANDAFQIDPSPWSVDVSGSGISLAGGIFWGLSVSGGTPGQARSGAETTGIQMHNPVEGDVIGVAVDLLNKNIWVRNVTQDPTDWYGVDHATTSDVEAFLKGVKFDSASGDREITGNIYILGGSGWENFGPRFPLGSLTLNAGGPFVGDLPTGFSAWGNTIWNTGDASPHLIFSNGDKTFITDEALPGSNQPTAFVRSVSSKVQS